MIILVIIALVAFYFILKSYTRTAIHADIQRYAKIVDEVFLEKDKKIEELEDRLSDMQLRISKLEDRDK